MEELLKHLAEVSIRQQQIMEHMAARQGESEREITALRTATAQRVAPSDPRTQATQLLPKMTAHNDAENYLQMFEAIATQEGWPREEWARVLVALLMGEAQHAYFSMTLAQSGSYDELQKEILARTGLSPICAAQLFHDWEYKARLPAQAQAAELTCLAPHWLLAGESTAAQVAERVVIDHLLRALPRPLRQAAGIVPQNEPMPTEPPRSPDRAWLAGCVVHHEPPAGALPAKVKMNGWHYQAILESGHAVSLVQPKVLPPRAGSKTLLPITCVHGDTRQVPVCRVTVSAAPGAWPIEVGIVKDLPVPVLLGRDWPGFDRLLAAVSQPASPDGNRQNQTTTRGPQRWPILLASDSTRDGETPSQNSNLFYDVFRQVSGGGAFAKEQNGDDRLKHCWSQVRVIEGKEIQLAPHPVPNFVVQNGLLYCVAQRKGEEKRLLVVPRPKTETMMELAHSHPMAGHLGAAKHHPRDP
uniref:Uncharacterized protein n=1 Tax=Cyprinus carpio TaxID=7962 RepID=A0A8C2EHX4_CYPCA